MADGSEVARGVSQIVLMDSDFSHLPEVVREGRRCINNVRGSSSLFVMKTIFAILISLFAVFTVTGYPFQPRNFVFLELFIIGVGSFLLALEPNNERIKGDFLEHVLTCSFPYAIGIFIPTLALLVFGSYSGYPISVEVRDAIAMCAVILAGYINLTNICRPYTKWRLGVVVTIGVLLAGGVGLGFLLDEAFGFGFHLAISDLKVLIISLVMAFASAVMMHILREPIAKLVGIIVKKINERKKKNS
jgi:cation-transporting ATPase E